MHNEDSLKNRAAPLAMNPEEFRELGAQLIDRIVSFLESLPNRPVTLRGVSRRRTACSRSPAHFAATGCRFGAAAPSCR